MTWLSSLVAPTVATSIARILSRFGAIVCSVDLHASENRVTAQNMGDAQLARVGAEAIEFRISAIVL
jgi:hypothetical protein